VKWRIALPTWLNIISVVILLVGLGSAVLIYQRAANDSTSVLGYQEEGGSVYPVNPQDSKMFLRDLELYGGKANVLAYQLRSWFVGLWHGKPLAFTIACITIVVSYGFFYAAGHLRSRLKSDVRNQNNRDGTA
jgi:hypothetical protein